MSNETDNKERVSIMCPNCNLQYTRTKGDLLFDEMTICPNCKHYFKHGVK